jgi:hypothetical protein
VYKAEACLVLDMQVSLLAAMRTKHVSKAEACIWQCARGAYQVTKHEATLPTACTARAAVSKYVAVQQCVLLDVTE